jgi:hypothetical protein
MWNQRTETSIFAADPEILPSKPCSVSFPRLRHSCTPRCAAEKDRGYRNFGVIRRNRAKFAG